MLRNALQINLSRYLLWKHSVRSCYNLYKMTGLSGVFVRSVPDDDRIQINFTWVSRTTGRERQFNFSRAKNEEISATLARINANISKFMNKKKKKNVAAGDAEHEVEVKLFVNGETCTNVNNEKAWVEGAVLQVDDTMYNVILNPPHISKIKVPEYAMVGFEIHPLTESEFTELEKSEIKWYRGDASENSDTQAQKKQKCKPEEQKWIEISQGLSYTPTSEDLNRTLKIIAVPSNGEIQGAAIESEEFLIHDGPKDCPFERRQQLYTSDVAENNRLRVISYNILADVYADSEFSRDYLFPYCPAFALTYDYRKQLLAKELPGYKADIICLQECDLKMFKKVLQPCLDLEGLEGHVKVKPGEVSEGCAIFWRKSKLRLLADHSLDNMMETFQQDALFSDLLAKVMSLSVEEERNKFLQRKAVLEVAALEDVSDPSRLLLVATTHFYFHPRANNIRLIQTMIATRHLEKIVNMYKSQGRVPGVIFCGDLNSHPMFGVYELLTTGSIPANHADWWSEGKQGFIGDTALSQPFQFESCCGIPAYTNYVTSFVGCLDYIFVDKTKFTTERVIPLPTHEAVTRNVALPNTHFPSDHLPIICEIKWKTPS